MEKRIRKTNLPKIILGIFALAFIVAGGFFLYKTAYEKGREDGRKNYESETADLVKNLATAVSEKAEDSKTLTEGLSNLPAEANQESITSYLDALGNIELKNTAAKDLLKSYQDAWQALKTTYETGDNEKIKSEFETLKNTAKETAEKLQALYDNNIATALEKL